MLHEAYDMPNQRHTRLQKRRFLPIKIYGSDLSYEVEDHYQRCETYVRSEDGHSD